MFDSIGELVLPWNKGRQERNNRQWFTMCEGRERFDNMTTDLCLCVRLLTVTILIPFRGVEQEQSLQCFGSAQTQDDKCLEP